VTASERWSALRVAIVNMWIASSGKPVSRKLVRSLVTGAVVYGVTYAVAKLGLKLNSTETAMIPEAAGLIGGFAVGWLTREFPQIVSDGTAVAPQRDPTPVSVPSKPAPVEAAPAPLLPSQRPLAYHQNPIPGMGDVRVVPPAASQDVPDDADAGTVTMAAIRVDKPPAAAPAVGYPVPAKPAEPAPVEKPQRFTGPREVGPRTVI
jgi:hypothetical protein